MKTNSLKKNAVFNVIYQIVQIGMPILLIPILSGRLDTSGNGSYAFIHSIVLIFTYLALLGVNYYGTRTIAASKVKNDEEVGKNFWSIFLSKSFSSLIAILCYIIFIITFLHINGSSYDNLDKIVFITQILFLIGNLLDVSWFFMGDENFKSLCIRNLAIKTLIFVLIIIFVKNQDDVWVYSIILGSGEILNHLFMWILLFKKRIFKYIKLVNLASLKTSFKGLLLFFIPQILIEFYTIINTVILGAFASYDEVAFFDYAQKIVSVLTTISISLSTVMLPRISYLYAINDFEQIKKKIEKSMEIALFIAIPIIFGVIGTGHSFVKWFLSGEKWSYVGVLLYILPLKVSLVVISNTIGVQYLIPSGRMKEFIYSVLFGSITCLILNFCLVPFFYSLGSVIAIVVSELAVSLAQMYFVRKDINVFNVFKKNIKPFLSGIIMLFFLFLTYHFCYNNMVDFFSTFINYHVFCLVISDLIIMFCGAILYFSILLLSKYELPIRFWKKIINKIYKKRVLLSTLGLCFVFSITSCFSFRTMYDVDFCHTMNIEKRTNCVGLSKKYFYSNSAANLISMNDDLLNLNSNLKSFSSEEIERLQFSTKNSSGFDYLYVDDELAAIQYTFYIWNPLNEPKSAKSIFTLQKNKFVDEVINSLEFRFYLNYNRCDLMLAPVVISGKNLNLLAGNDDHYQLQFSDNYILPTLENMENGNGKKDISLRFSIAILVKPNSNLIIDKEIANKIKINISFYS